MVFSFSKILNLSIWSCQTHSWLTKVVFPKAFRTLFRIDHMLYKKLIFTSTWVLMPTFSQSQVPTIWRSACMEAFHNTDCMNTCFWGAGTLQMSTLLTRSPSSYLLRPLQCYLKSCAGWHSVYPTQTSFFL